MGKNGSAWTTAQVAEFLGAHIETIRRLARRGEIPSYKIGTDWRFKREAIEHWAETHHGRQQSPLVMVVDDEKSIRDTTQLFLNGAGYRAMTASSGDEALKLARSEIPDLVLLDLVMPGMSGVEVLRELHAMDADLPVVVITAYPDGELMTEALKYPPVILLQKPLNKVTLLKTVDRVLRGSSSRSRV